LRGIPDFQSEDAGGTSKFQAYLDGLESRTGIGNLEAVIIIGDNDDAPAERFRELRTQLKKARLPYPDNPLEIARRANPNFAVIVVMLPFTAAGAVARGCLETILLESAAQRHAAIKLCVDGYAACVGVNGWSIAKTSKMLLRCILSAAWPDDPNYGLQYALNPAKNLIPLDHTCFDLIAHFLEDFPTGLGAGQFTLRP